MSTRPGGSSFALRREKLDHWGGVCIVEFRDFQSHSARFFKILLCTRFRCLNISADPLSASPKGLNVRENSWLGMLPVYLTHTTLLHHAAFVQLI